MRIHKSNISGFFLFVLVRIFLDLAYIYCVAPIFSYEGYILEENTPNYVFSWVLYLLIFPIVPVRLRKVSDAVFMLIAVSIIAPLTSMYGLAGESAVPVITAVASMAFVYAITNVRLFKDVRLPYLKDGERVAVLLSVAMVFLVVAHYAISGVELNFSFSEVYDFRETNAEAAGVGIFAYLNTWAFQVFNVFLIAVCLMRRQYVFLAIFLGIQVFLFAASQHKSVLFAPLLIIGVWRYMRRSNSLLIIPISVCVLIAASILIYVINDNVVLPSMALRRTLFTPARLAFAYFSFFSESQKIWWGDSFWMPFMDSPYSTTMPYVIGSYLGSPSLGANNGYVSSGFGQAGFFGVFIYSFILGYLLKFVDKESQRIGEVWFGVGLFLIPFLTIWQSSDLATAMLTHGFLVMLGLLGLMRRSQSTQPG